MATDWVTVAEYDVHMYVYMAIHIHIHAHVEIHMYTNICLYIDVDVYLQIKENDIYVHMFAGTSKYLCEKHITPSVHSLYREDWCPGAISLAHAQQSIWGSG